MNFHHAHFLQLFHTIKTLKLSGLISADLSFAEYIMLELIAELADEAFLIFVTNAPILIGVTDKTAANPTVVYRFGEDSINLRGLKAN